MSGLLESIARRRRASASSRLGPPPEADANHAETSNGSAPQATAQGNGAPRWVPVSKLPATPEAPRTPDPPRTSDAAPTPVQPVEQPKEVRAPPDAPWIAIVAGPTVEQAPDPAPATPEPVAVEPELAPATPEPVAAEPQPAPAPVPAEPEPPEATPEPVAAVAEPGPLRPTPDPSAPEPVPPIASGFLQRGRVRRRARYLRQLRELQLRDLGGFMVELQRHGRQRPDLVQAKLAEALRTDEELRGLDRALGTDQPLRELREPGIGGACGNCGALHGSRDRFCASCGEPVGAG